MLKIPNAGNIRSDTSMSLLKVVTKFERIKQGIEIEKTIPVRVEMESSLITPLFTAIKPTMTIARMPIIDVKTSAKLKLIVISFSKHLYLCLNYGLFKALAAVLDGIRGNS
jgi:hypothetical protein